MSISLITYYIVDIHIGSIFEIVLDFVSPRYDMVEKEIEVKTQLGSHAELEIVQRSHFARFQ